MMINIMIITITRYGRVRIVRLYFGFMCFVVFCKLLSVYLYIMGLFVK